MLSSAWTKLVLPAPEGALMMKRFPDIDNLESKNKNKNASPEKNTNKKHLFFGFHFVAYAFNKSR